MDVEQQYQADMRDWLDSVNNDPLVMPARAVVDIATFAAEFMERTNTAALQAQFADNEVPVPYVDLAVRALVANMRSLAEQLQPLGDDLVRVTPGRLDFERECNGND